MKIFYQGLFIFVLLLFSLVHGYSVYDMTADDVVYSLNRPILVQYTPDPTPGITTRATGILDIVIVDSITREPVEGVKVSVSTTSSVTITSWSDENGVVTIDHSDYAATTAELTKSGYDTLVIDANTNGTVEFVETVPDPGQNYEVMGTVIAADTGAPLAEAKIYFYSRLNGSTKTETVYTNETGEYVLTAEGGDSADIIVSFPGYASEGYEIEPGSHTINVTLDLVSPGTGDVWIYPSPVTFHKNRSFDLEVHVNTGIQGLAAYGFDLTYDTVVLSCEGYDAGPDGFVSATSGDYPGEIRLSGFDPQGTGPGEDIHLLNIYFTPRVTTGSSTIGIIINSMLDPFLEDLGTFNPINGEVTIAAPAFGDVNNDNEVTIIDALIVARYYVSGDPSILDIEAADVNQSGIVDIIDALRIAQFYVGLIRRFG